MYMTAPKTEIAIVIKKLYKIITSWWEMFS